MKIKKRRGTMRDRLNHANGLGELSEKASGGDSVLRGAQARQLLEAYGLRPHAEVLADFAKPVLDGLAAQNAPESSFREGLTMAMLCWNAQVAGVARDEVLDKLERDSGAKIPQRDEVARVWDMLAARKRERHPDDPRIYVGMRVSIDAQGRPHIHATAKLPLPDKG